MNNYNSDKIVNKASSVANGLLNKIPASQEQIEGFVNKAGEKAGELTSNFAQTASHSIESGREYVKANPVKGVAIAAGAGLVAGGLLMMLFRGRKDN